MKKLVMFPSTLFIIVLGIAIHYRAWKKEWRIYFNPIYMPLSFQTQTSETFSTNSYHW